MCCQEKRESVNKVWCNASKLTCDADSKLANTSKHFKQTKWVRIDFWWFGTVLYAVRWHQRAQIASLSTHSKHACSQLGHGHRPLSLRRRRSQVRWRWRWRKRWRRWRWNLLAGKKKLHRVGRAACTISPCNSSSFLISLDVASHEEPCRPARLGWGDRNQDGRSKRSNQNSFNHVCAPSPDKMRNGKQKWISPGLLWLAVKNGVM